MDRDWSPHAVCRELSPKVAFAVFFPADRALNKEESDYTAARSFCDRCPVQKHCLEMALAAEGGLARGSRFGMFGGKTPLERAKIQKLRDDGDNRRGVQRIRPWHHGRPEGWRRGCRCDICQAWRTRDRRLGHRGTAA